MKTAAIKSNLTSAEASLRPPGAHCAPTSPIAGFYGFYF